MAWVFSVYLFISHKKFSWHTCSSLGITSTEQHFLIIKGFSDHPKPITVSQCRCHHSCHLLLTVNMDRQLQQQITSRCSWAALRTCLAAMYKTQAEFLCKAKERTATATCERFEEGRHTESISYNINNIGCRPRDISIEYGPISLYLNKIKSRQMTLFISLRPIPLNLFK